MTQDAGTASSIHREPGPCTLAEFTETATRLDLHEVISSRATSRNELDMENLTWASSPTARGIVQKRLDWFVADGDGLDDVGDVITIQPWMSLANGSAATDHATIVTELTWDHQRAAEDQREKPRRTKVNWQIARRGRFLQDMEALLHEAATPIKELYQLELYAEVQEYGDRTHDAIIELYDTHRKEIERGRRAGSKKAKRALSRYVIETLHGSLSYARYMYTGSIYSDGNTVCVGRRLQWSISSYYVRYWCLNIFF
jgi:hypothetical protein